MYEKINTPNIKTLTNLNVYFKMYTEYMPGVAKTN